MLKSPPHFAVAALALSMMCVAPASAASRGSHGSHGGGGGHSHGGGSHGGGGGLFHGGASHGGGGHSFFGSHRGGGGSAGHSMSFGRGGMRGSSRGAFGRSGSHGGSSPRFDSRAFANSGGRRSFSGPGRSQGNWGMAGPGSRGSFSGRNSWGGSSFTSRNFAPSHNFSSFSPGSDSRAAINSWNSGRTFNGRNTGGNGYARNGFSRSGSFDSNRPPSSQFRSSNQFGPAFRGSSSWSGRAASARASSSGFDRSVNSRGFVAGRSALAAPSARNGFGPANTARHVSFGSNRPPSTGRGTLGNLAGRSSNSWSNASYFRSNAVHANFGHSNFGNGRMNGHDFGGGNFRTAAMSHSGANRSFGSGRFGGSRNSDFGGNRFGHSGYGHGRFGGRGYGYNHSGYGHFGYGHFGYEHFGWGGGWWDDPFADLWFLGDLFGLALDIGRFAIMPAWGFIGADLVGTGLQALSNLGGDDYGNNSYGDNSYGYYNDDSYGSYNAYDNADQPYYTTRVGFIAAPCGNYYSDENPGCRQQF